MDETIDSEYYIDYVNNPDIELKVSMQQNEKEYLSLLFSENTNDVTKYYDNSNKPFDNFIYLFIEKRHHPVFIRTTDKSEFVIATITVDENVYDERYHLSSEITKNKHKEFFNNKSITNIRIDDPDVPEITTGGEPYFNEPYYDKFITVFTDPKNPSKLFISSMDMFDILLKMKNPYSLYCAIISIHAENNVYVEISSIQGKSHNCYIHSDETFNWIYYLCCSINKITEFRLIDIATYSVYSNGIFLDVSVKFIRYLEGYKLQNISLYSDYGFEFLDDDMKILKRKLKENCEITVRDIIYDMKKLEQKIVVIDGFRNEKYYPLFYKFTQLNPNISFYELRKNHPDLYKLLCEIISKPISLDLQTLNKLTTIRKAIQSACELKLILNTNQLYIPRPQYGGSHKVVYTLLIVIILIIFIFYVLEITPTYSNIFQYVNL